MVAFLLTKGFKIKKDNNKPFLLQDFLPHIKPDVDEDGEVTLESAMRALGVKP